MTWRITTDDKENDELKTRKQFFIVFVYESHLMKTLIVGMYAYVHAFWNCVIVSRNELIIIKNHINHH